MKVIFLGTNGWYDTSTGNTISILLDYSEYYIILDAGYGFTKLDYYLTEKKPAYLFLSHFHLDHIVGLHALLKIPFQDGLTIFGQEDLKKNLNIILASPFSVPLERMPYDLSIYEIPEEKNKIPFNYSSLLLKHAEPCWGIRLEIDNSVIAYCPDTGYCENAVELSKNADLVITECAYRPGESYENWPHLNPESAAKIASEAEAKKLVLVHFDALRYKTIEDRKVAENEGQKYFKNTIAATDNLVIEV